MISKKFLGVIGTLLVIVALLSGLVATPVLAEPVVKVKVLLGFHKQPGPVEEALVRGAGGEIKYTFHIVRVIAAKVPEPVINALRANPNVTYVEHDGTVKATQETLPWGVDRIDAELVHPANKGTGIKVSIIDTGIDWNHPDLDANYKGGYDFVNDDTDPMDDNGHGTHCAGIIAAEDSDIGVIGVAPEAYLYAVKVLDQTGSGYVSDVVAGIQWSIDNGMQISSMSLGTNTDYQTLHDACDAAYAANIIVAAAAGNDGNKWATGDNVDYPARYDSVIAVAATDQNDKRAVWRAFTASSTGPAVELAAPGDEIYSTYWDDTYATKSGTSMACPHVTGTAALVWASYPNYSNVQVRQRLCDMAEDLGDTGRDSEFGYGLVDTAAAAAPPADAPPVVDIVSPADGATLSGSVSIQVSASDDKGVDGVEYKIDTGSYQPMTYNPITLYWEATWDSTAVVDGSHTIIARATDTIGQTSTDSITVNVDNVDNPPTVEIISPTDGATVSGAITVKASTSDDKGVSKVDFYIDDVLLATDDTSPYECSWDTTTAGDGSHSIKATATDTAKQTASDTNAVTVDNTPPAQVTGLTVNTVSSSELGLFWDANTETDLDHYSVYRSTTSGGPYDLIASPTTNSYSDTGLAASTTYYYTVTAIDVVGNEGASSSEASSTTSEAVANLMHVSAIDMWYTMAGPNYFVYTKVSIVDANGAVVPQATVYLEMTLPDGSKASGSRDTNGEGTVTFKLRSRQTDTYTSIVIDVVKADWTYESEANVETSKQLIVP